MINREAVIYCFPPILKVMKTSGYIFSICFIMSALFLMQCEPDKYGCTDPRSIYYDVSANIDDGSCSDLLDETQGCRPFNYGNLVINNETGSTLLLYNNNSFITCIPAYEEEFLINVPNSNLEVCLLQVWKSEDVENKNQPAITNVYRTWNVALSNTTIEDEISYWLISENTVNQNSGTLNISYSSVDDYGHEVIYQVDIFLNTKNGAKIASLKPGSNDKKVSIDYGVHYLYFRYWYSDPGSSSGNVEEIGWNQLNDIVVNAEHNTTNVTVPAFYSKIGKYGSLQIINLLDYATSIYANGSLIETIAKVEGSSQGLSIIPAQNSTSFLIPVDNYVLTAKNIDGSSIIQSLSSIDILQEVTTVCWIGSALKTISVVNNTIYDLLLFDRDNNYLGTFLSPGSSSGEIVIPDIFDTIRAVTPDRSLAYDFAPEGNIIVSALTEFETVNFTITQSWTVAGYNHYTSPTIDDGQTTVMIAQLKNPKKTRLSFEYKVSSEANYDFFNFSVDDTYELNHLSGDLDWQIFTVEIVPGSHTLKWEYSKDIMVSEYSDNVEIRNINIE